MNNVVHIDRYIAVRNLRANWKDWDIVTRAEAIAKLRQTDVSVATLSRIANCSAALILRLELIDQLSPESKARIRAAAPSGKFVGLAKALRLSQSIGITPTR
jgi:hypothetical protein